MQFLFCMVLFILLELENRTIDAVGWDEMVLEEYRNTRNNFLHGYPAKSFLQKHL